MLQDSDALLRASDHDRSNAAASTGADVAPHTKPARAAGVDMKKFRLAGWATCCRKLEEVAAHLQHVVREAARRTSPTSGAGSTGRRAQAAAVACGRAATGSTTTKASPAAWHDRRRAWGLV